MRREIDNRTLERSEVLMTNVWGQEELDRTAVFWEIAQKRPDLAKEMVDAGQVLRHRGRAELTRNKLPISRIVHSGVSVRLPSADSFTTGY